MEPIKDTNLGLELELQIEELEDRIAPDGGETVLPLVSTKHHGH
jgi:hypothetical protein